MRTRLAALVLAALSAVPPALATHEGIHPTFRTEADYFHCSGSTKLQNLDGPAPWDTTAPAQSYTQGAGCGSLDTFFYSTGANMYDASFQGTFTGNLRDLTVRVHNLVLGGVRAPGTPTSIGVRLDIDGQSYLPGVYGTRLDVTPVPSSTGVSELLEFSLTDIGSATDVKDAEGEVIDVLTTGLATDDADGTTERDILLILTPFFTPYSNAFVWDATEIASGIVFNPATLAGARAKVTLPEQEE